MRSSIRTALVAAGSAAALAAVAPNANASYFTTNYNSVCKNAGDIHGLGASGIRSASEAWGNTLLEPSPGSPLTQGFGYDAGADYATCAAFKTAGDGGTKVLDYAATGSGSCITYLSTRSYTYLGTPVTNRSYCQSEDAPTEAQITTAEAGSPAHVSEAQLVTIPVAQTAISISVRLPNGCQVADQSKRDISRQQANLAFEGVNSTWNDVFGTDMTAVAGSGLTSAECRAKAFKRVVRLDSSGSTFLLKRYLYEASHAAGGDSFDWRQPSHGGTLANNAWPNDAGATAVLRGDENGTPSMLAKASTQTANGAITYGDVGSARDASYAWDYTGGAYTATDTSLWLRVQRIPNDAYVSPGVANAQSATGGNAGAACVNVEYSGAPTSNLGASWANADAISTPTDFPICGLGYAVTSLWGFDSSPGRPNLPVWAGVNEAQYRTVRDYLRYVTGIIRPGVGPSRLAPAGFARMPDAIQATAQCASKVVGYLRASSDPTPGSPIPRDPSGSDPAC